MSNIKPCAGMREILMLRHFALNVKKSLNVLMIETNPNYLVENSPFFFVVGYQFCDDGIHVIRKEKFCDGSDKGGCRDESDEAAIYCEEPYFTGCPSGMFQCTVEGLCISNELVCDGTFHCKQNLTDEDFHVCDKWECTKGYVKLSGM